MAISPLQRHVSAADLPPERLAANTTLSEKEKVAEASRQFEAILVRQILDASQKTVIQSKFSDNSTAATIYHDMVTNQLADAISKSGSLGLSAIFERQLNRPGADPVEDVPDESTVCRNPEVKAILTTQAVGSRHADGTRLAHNHSDLSRQHP